MLRKKTIKQQNDLMWFSGCDQTAALIPLVTQESNIRK